MRKFKAETASTNIDSDKDQFTEDDLKSMLNLPPQYCSILMDFDSRKPPVGIVETSIIKDNKVILTGFINDGLEGYFVVPAGFIKHDKNGKMEKLIVNQFGCTDKPTDKSLSPLQYIDE